MNLSVIIPTCDRPGMLQECLRRVTNQGVGSYEVIVSDDSRPGIQWPVPEGVRRVQGPRRGPAANRNCGARHATGEWLIFLDDDCLPEEGWLAAYEEAARSDVDVLEGRTECPQADTLAIYDIVENLTGGAFWSCNLAVRREIFEELRGFDEDFTRPCAEDMEFAWRLRERGLKAVFVEQATVTHPVRRIGLAGLLRKTAAHRWVILYRLKTGRVPALGCSAVRAVAALVVREYLDSLRMFLHLWRRDEKRVKGRTIKVLWRWVSLPPFLPYYIYWEMRYRGMLQGRRKKG